MRTCAAQLPALEAEESILATQRLTVGIVALDRRERERIVTNWLDTIDPHRPRVVKPGSHERLFSAAAASGLGVHVLERGADRG